jgi:uncharacterized protein (TIGR02246 family)
MRLTFALPLFVAAIRLGAQSPDEMALRNIIKDEINTWNTGDAVGYSRHFAAGGTFTNIRGEFFSGYPAFLKQHEVIFKGVFRRTTMKQEVVSLKFVRPDLAIVETVTTVAGASQAPPGVTRDSSKRIRTRLMQVALKSGGAWTIVAYHNVDVKPGIHFPYPR